MIEGGEEDAGTLATAAESLGMRLENQKLVKSARWKPRWNEEPQGIAELLAYLWLNGDPAAAQAQTARLSPARSEATLKESLGKVATSMEGWTW